MKWGNSLFSKLVITLMVAIGLSGLTFLIVGLEGFKASERYIQEQIRRHVISTASGQIGTLIEIGELEKIEPVLRGARESSGNDEASLAFISKISRELSKSKPDAVYLKSLVEGWQIYQSNEVLRLVDDHEAAYRSVVFKGWMTWIFFAVLCAMIGRQMFSYAVRPVRYLTEYFQKMDLSRGVGPVFPTLDDRKESGVDDAAAEVQGLFQGMESLVSQVQEFRSINIHRLMEQKARAEVMASVSRDAIFFLRQNEVVWCNRLGADLLGLASRRADLPLDLVGSHHSAPSSLVRTLLTATKKETPIEWRSADPESENESQSFLFSQSTANWQRWGYRLDFDAVVIGQNVTWIRQAEEAKSHFVGLLAHEVKTPVTSLLMATRLLQRSGATLNSVQKKLVDSSVRDVERLRELIDELFSASRFDLDVERLDFRAVDLRRLISQSVRSIRPEAEARNITMDLAFEGLAAEVMMLADAPRISWSLTQVITHALRHSPKNSRVEVRISEESVQSKKVFQIVVRSIGAPTLDQVGERIFQRTFAHYDLRVARSNSTGMSLAIAREIAVGHGGTLALNPEYRDGAEFILTLPQERGQDPMIRAEC